MKRPNSMPPRAAGWRRVLSGFSGVTITEAVKDVYAALPLRKAPRRRLVLAEAA